MYEFWDKGKRYNSKSLLTSLISDGQVQQKIGFFHYKTNSKIKFSVNS